MTETADPRRRWDTDERFREHLQDEGVVFDVITGVPEGGQFATHGHTLRLTVYPPQT